MEIAKISYKKKISLSETLRNMPIGVEQIIPAKIFPTGKVRRTASKLKAEGYLFTVSTKGVLVDTAVTRLS